LVTIHIAANQEICCFMHAGQVGAWGVFHFCIHFGADANEYGLETFLEKAVNRFIFANVCIWDEFHTGSLKLFPLFLPYFLGEFEIRNAVHKQSARRRLGFKNGHIMPLLNKHFSAAQTSRGQRRSQPPFFLRESQQE
jgi:hypothetical protein